MIELETSKLTWFPGAGRVFGGVPCKDSIFSVTYEAVPDETH